MHFLVPRLADSMHVIELGSLPRCEEITLEFSVFYDDPELIDVNVRGWVSDTIYIRSARTTDHGCLVAMTAVIRNLYQETTSVAPVDPVAFHYTVVEDEFNQGSPSAGVRIIHAIY